VSPPKETAAQPLEGAVRPRSRERLARFEPTAVSGVFSRELTVFTKRWPSVTFQAIVEPTLYLLAFGFGFGALLNRVAGVSYIDYVGTGVVAAAVLFGSAMPGMFSTFVKRRFQRIYDAVLAAPVSVEELVTAEILWLATRAGLFALAPLLVAVALGLRPGPLVVLVPLIGFVAALGFAAFGITMSAISKSIDTFSYVTSGVLTPLLLLSGAFFPLAVMPEWVQVIAQVNPLYHTVELVRHAVFGLQPMADLAHVGLLLVIAAVMWRLAVWRMRLQLIV
jgi:lipooligosaccharide transport system permease protein